MSGQLFLPFGTNQRNMQKLMHTLFAFMQKSCKKSELYYFTVMAIKGLFIHLQDQVKINLLPERLICDLVSEFLAAINETGKENESKKIHAALGDVIVLFSEKLHDEEEITTIFNGVVNYVLHEPVSADLCFAVQSIANIFSKSHKQRCEMAQILEKIMSFFDNDALRRPATQVIGEIVAYEDEPAVTKLLNEFDLLERIYTILCSHENVLDHCYWILYNISVTSDDHTKLICFHEKLFPKILEHFRTLEEGKPLMSIIYLIHCAIHRISGESDSSLFLETLIAQKVPVTLCKWLYSEKQGSTCLDCLDVMLNKAEKLVNGDTVVFNPVAIQIAECNGIEKLHKFVESASVQNGKRVTKLLSKHFGEQFAASRRVWTTKKAV